MVTKRAIQQELSKLKIQKIVDRITARRKLPPQSEWSRILNDWLLERAMREYPYESCAKLAARAKRELGFGAAGKISELIRNNPVLTAWRYGDREVVLQFVDREAISTVDMRTVEELIESALASKDFRSLSTTEQAEAKEAISSMNREQLLGFLM